MPRVSVDKIQIGKNRRPLNEEKVAQLVESIQANGLLNPITIDENFNLIAGLHRLKACKLLKLTQIECNIVNYADEEQARLAQIDENLIRNELKPLERGMLVLEREKILTRLGLRAKPGDNQYTLKDSQSGGEIISSPAKTTQELAKQSGYSERSWQHDKQIARDIAPKIQQLIRRSPLAPIKTELLKIARVGSTERMQAQQAVAASQDAASRGEELVAQRQLKLAAQFTAKSEELQLQAFTSAIARREAKLALKKVESLVQQPELIKLNANHSRMELGDKWTLNNRHLVYYGNTASVEFIDLIPTNAMLAIATVSQTWNHDYLVDRAATVAVLRSEGQIFPFCSSNRIPFQYELILGKIYLGIFSHQSITKPQTPINIEGVEAIVQYLVNLYTKPGNFVIAPFMGHGEILMACEKTKRVCFTGDQNPESISRGIMRWQKWSGKQPEKIVRSSYLYF